MMEKRRQASIMSHKKCDDHFLSCLRQKRRGKVVLKHVVEKRKKDSLR
jgi:hypothetical protein